MTQDIASIIAGWVQKGDQQSARVIRTADGRQVLQYYEAQTVLQMEMTGRPDGIRPFDCDTVLEHVQTLPTEPKPSRVPTPQQWMELDREFAQFQQRRRAALLVAARLFVDGRSSEAAPLYQLAVQDVQHCLAILDLAVDRHPAHRLVSAQPEIRPRLIAQLHLASAQAQLVDGCIDAAVERLKNGIREVEQALDTLKSAAPDRESILRDLKIMEQAVRERYSLSATLSEQLDDALTREDYEQAAVLRDQIAGQRQAVLDGSGSGHLA